jgi:signal transduction histidine kinase/DNA-binding response OmpR family regulator
MRKTNLFFTAIFLLFTFLSCGKDDAKQPNGKFQYTSYRDIPGVTGDEIKAIEALREQKDFFVYGITPTTEAFYDEDNTIRGYATLFCAWLTDFIGIPFKPVVYEWGDLIAGLESGEIDLSGDLSPTEERRRTYLMTGPIAQRTIKYIRLKSSPSIAEIAATRPLRLIFFDGSITYDHVVSSGAFDTEDASFEVFFVNDNEAAYHLLENGKADAVLTENVLEAAFDSYGEVTSEDFFPMIYSPVSLTTKNPLLEGVISVVQKALQNDGLRYLTPLYSQGYRVYLKHKLFMRLSEEEKAYIHTNPVVLFTAENDNYPISFYNTRENLWQGVAFDVLAEIQALTGLTFEIANDPDTDWPVILQMLEDGETAMVTELIRSEERKGRFLWPDSHFMTDFYALLSKTEFPDINTSEILYARVGLSRGTAHAALFKNWFPDHEYTTEYENTNAAFDALDRGEIDLVMSSQHQFLTFTNFRELPGYKINVAFDRIFESTFGFNKNEAALCSIVDKAISMIDTKAISGQWVRKTYDYRIKLVEAQRPWFIGSSVWFLSAFALVAVLLVINRRAAQKLELQSQEVLAASEAKGNFLATMSHEMRTPLNAIIGMTAIGKRSTDMEIKNYTLEKIDDASTHLLGVINDILDMSKIEANKLELSPIEFNFERMLQKVITVINFRMAEKRQQFSVNVDTKAPPLLISDDQRLAQVITNLLSNAVKFTPVEGEICLTVSLLGKTPDLCELRVEVADNGIGISPEQQKKLFSAFEQAESGISREFGGTGLGLAISRRIIELMDGRIWIESEIGKGSRFIFTIRVPYGEENLRSQLTSNVQWQDLRVLAVDDSPLMCQYFSGIFDQLGIHCEVTGDGHEACRIIKENGGFDIYFIDWRMPGMDGLELTKWIKSNGIRGKVILFSSAELEEVREASLRSGADKCLIKPFLSSTIIDCLNECFGTSGKHESHEHDNQFAGKTLLIVEDIEINREILLSLLENTGLNIDCAGNGEEAVARITAAPEKYDIVFMDMQMPVMDGLEATRRIRALSAPRCKEIPIIAMTANVFKDDVEHCLAAGMNDHVGKPINIDEVFEKLRKVL